MTRIFDPREAGDMHEFAKRAAKVFAASEKFWTYTDDGDVNAGQLFAVRWGVAGQAVLVFYIDEFREPLIYPEMGCDIPKAMEIE